jgi:hypothetical protein
MYISGPYDDGEKILRKLNRRRGFASGPEKPG